MTTLSDPPLVAFSPGSRSLAAFYTTYNRGVTSYSFIVMGVDHTYDSFLLEFPDGQIVEGILTDANISIAAEVRKQDVL